MLLLSVSPADVVRLPLPAALNSLYPLVTVSYHGLRHAARLITNRPDRTRH